VTNTARQLDMVLGSTALTMIYQTGIDIAAVLALQWKGVAEESRKPAEVQCVGGLAD
jgi:hypothetical protein